MEGHACKDVCQIAGPAKFMSELLKDCTRLPGGPLLSETWGRNIPISNNLQFKNFFPLRRHSQASISLTVKQGVPSLSKQERLLDLKNSDEARQYGQAEGGGC